MNEYQSDWIQKRRKEFENSCGIPFTFHSPSCQATLNSLYAKAIHFINPLRTFRMPAAKLCMPRPEKAVRAYAAARMLGVDQCLRQLLSESTADSTENHCQLHFDNIRLHWHDFLPFFFF